MKKIFIKGFWCMLLALSAAGCRNTGKHTVQVNPVFGDTSHYTRAEWLDSVVNFGTIKMGETIEVRFRVRNIGNKPLLLSDVRAVCGCTIANYTESAIPPGAEGVVVGVFDSKKAHVGTVRKSILATTNSHNGINHNLIFTGVINE
jgi:hypothetical protein